MGKSSLSGQYVSIGRGCENPLIVAHEIGISLDVFGQLSDFVSNSRTLKSMLSSLAVVFYSLGAWHF